MRQWHTRRPAADACMRRTLRELLLAGLAGAAGRASIQELQRVAGEAPAEGRRIVLVTGSEGGSGRKLARRPGSQGDLDEGAEATRSRLREPSERLTGAH